MAILEQIFAHAARDGGRCAVADGAEQLRYAELIDRVERIAAALVAAGTAPADHVVIAAPKSVWTVAATLATWRVGAVHVPLDPALPDARLDSMLGRVRPAVVITDAAPVAAAGERAGARAIWAPARLREAPPATPPPWPRLESSTPAYCMFTSGSTGTPKGVVLGHGALDAFFADIVAVHDVDASASCLNTAPPFFDVTVLDTWFPLARGARVRLTGPADLFPPQLVHLLRDERISHLCMVAPLVKLVAQSGSLLERVRFPALRSLMTGAESPDPTAVQRWLDAAPQARVLNGYGPTEATCVCLVHAIEPHNATEAPYPIGGPLANVSHWLERDGATTRAPGAEGELLVGGPQLMLGYLGDPEQTRARLVDVGGAPHYRTGDLCRVRADGSVQFVGRVDEEIKLSGYRIHLGEVTTAALGFPGVQHAFASVVGDAARGSALALAVVLADGCQALDRPRLDAALGQRLPGYMMPRYVFAFDSFPSLASGKLDGATLRRELARRVAS